LRGSRISLIPLENIQQRQDVYQVLFQHVTRDKVLEYMPLKDYTDLKEFSEALECLTREKNIIPYVIYYQNAVAGFICYLNIHFLYKVVEIGMIWVGSEHRGKQFAIEATYLLTDFAIQQGIRRVEWKCHHLNVPSQTIAKKMGFVYEGTFRNHMFFKGISRDTIWFSIIPEEYEEKKKGFER
ncbi:acyl-CoA N-acyltransferase, partial [Gorgonomyces haynaldii]